MKVYRIAALIVVIFYSCTKVIELPSPEFLEQVVVNGVLNPDSTIKVKLSFNKTVASTKTTFRPIIGADVYVKINNNELVELKEKANGLYEVNMQPVAGNKYQLQVLIVGYPTITAEDSVPLPTSQMSICCVVANSNNPNNNPDITIKYNPNLESTVWFTYNRLDSNNGTSVLTESIGSNSPYLDPFNAKFISLYGQYSYRFISKVRSDITSPVDITFNPFNPFDLREMPYLNIIYASKVYDAYLKSIFTAIEGASVNNNGEVENPFGSFSPIYSNINNGIGVFGAYSTQKLVIKP